MIFRWRPTILTASVCLLGFVVVAAPATAGLINGNSKISVYQGVLSIFQSGKPTMELGAYGRDIASTGDVVLRPGSVDEAHGIYVQKSGSTANLSFGINGQLCLYSNAVYVCKGAWPIGADTFWSVGVDKAPFDGVTPPLGKFTQLRLDGGSPAYTFGLYLGDQVAGTPWVAGTHALEVFTNYGSGTSTDTWTTGTHSANLFPAVYIYGTLRLGDSAGGVSGNLNVNGSLGTFQSTFTIKNGITPYYGCPAGCLGTPEGDNSNLDADTFDGSDAPSRLPFPVAGNFANLFWKTAATGQTAICLHTTATGLCKSGPTIGLPCTSDANCGGAAGSCQKMCSTHVATCPAPASGHCESPGSFGNPGTPDASRPNCNLSNPCPVGEACVQGSLYRFQHGDPLCTGFSCAVDCSGTLNRGCLGQTNLCTAGGTWGDNLNYQAGSNTVIQGNASYCTVGVLSCDCHMTAPTPYQVDDGSTGGDLCTNIFQ